MRIAALVLGIAATVTIAGPAAADTVAVADIGSFHVGGRAVSLSGLPTKDVVFTAGSAPVKVDPNGDFEVEQMYVQYVKLAQPKAKYPLLLWHGGGLTGVTWETKPDGKPGWQAFFLRAGHDVYVSDAVERGRASWARYPEIFTSEPLFRTKKQAWEDFRIGAVGSYKVNPAERVALPGQLFPVESFDQFIKQGVPRWSTTDAQIQAAYNQLVQKVVPVRDHRAQPGRQLRLQRRARRARQGEGADRGRAVRRAQAGGGGGRARSRPSRTSWCGATTSGRARSGSASSPRRSSTSMPCARRAASPTGGSCPSSASPATATCS